MRLGDPLFLLLLLLVPVVLWRWGRGTRRVSIRFSSIAALESQAPSFLSASRFMPGLLRALALILLIVAMARPQKGNVETRVFNEGIAVQMVLDISSSMSEQDFVIRGRPANRLAAVKRVFEEFVEGTDELEGRESDLIGMITFARYADSKCPLTFDHANLSRILDGTEIVNRRDEDGTSIGDAIALGVERLRDIGQNRLGGGTHEIKSKVMILLTDGQQTVPESMDPAKAAQIAKAMGVKIYTIGAGSDGGTQRGVGLFRMMALAAPIDEATLKEVAEITGGQYFRATNMEGLRNIYEEIDQLEKTETEEIRYLQYAELARPLMLLAFGLLGFEVLLANTLYRRIP